MNHENGHYSWMNHENVHYACHNCIIEMVIMITSKTKKRHKIMPLLMYFLNSNFDS